MSNNNDTDQDSSEDKEMQRLFAAKPVRQQPTADLIERAKAAARPEWQAAVARAGALNEESTAAPSASLPGSRSGWALAAAIALATILLGWQLLLPTNIEIQVVHADGLRVNNVAQTVGVIHLQAGDKIVTDTLAEFAIPGSDGNAIELRLAANTRAHWLSANRLQLRNGGVYVDTHGSARFGITTGAGKIDDIGTRYIATFNGDVLEVAVSDGEIELATSSERVRATPTGGNTAAVLKVANRSIERTDEPVDSARWQWAMAHAHEYEGLLIEDALQAIAERLGKALIFESSGDLAEARSYSAQGQYAGLSANEALTLIANTNNLEVVETAKTLSVSFRSR